MENNEKDRFGKLLERHADAFAVKLESKRLSIYFDKLKRWKMVKVEQAIEDCFYSCSRFPTIQDIAKAYNSKNPQG